MKKIVFLIVAIFAIPLTSFAQTLDGIKFISPFNNDVAAVKKGEKWAFINKSGDLIIDYRDDLVTTKIDGDTYPVFNSDRCLISHKKDGISYFGYIDKKGNTVVEPEYLNATQFNNGVAIVIKLYKNVLGTNDVLDKQMIDYNYMEVAIDVNAEIIHYFTEKPIHVTLEKNFLKKPPKITSKFISDNLIATQNKDKTWSIKPYKL